MFIKFILLTILIFPTIGCSQMVGGTCTYETLYGTAEIVDSHDQEPSATFNPGQQHFTRNNVSFSRKIKFPVRAQITGKAGTLYPAQLSVITTGSCTPYRFALMSSEGFSQGIFVPFERNGNITAEGKQTLKQVAVIFEKLSPSWPQLVLNICGQTLREGSEEYNLQLGERYANKASQQLLQTGVPGTKIRTISAGEHPCPRSTIFADEVEHGAWLNILLTDKTPQ